MALKSMHECIEGAGSSSFAQVECATEDLDDGEHKGLL